HSGACQVSSAGGQDALEDLSSQDRTARDESGEVADRVCALLQQLPSLLGLVHATGRDDLARGAEGAAQRARVLRRTLCRVAGKISGPERPPAPCERRRSSIRRVLP